MGFISGRLFGCDDIMGNILIKIYRNTDRNIDVITDINTGVTYETDKPYIQKYSNENMRCTCFMWFSLCYGWHNP